MNIKMYTHYLKWSGLNSAKEISKTNPLNVLIWEDMKTQLPRILESNPHPNLIRISFADFLNEKKRYFAVLIRTFPSTAPCLHGRLIG